MNKVLKAARAESQNAAPARGALGPFHPPGTKGGAGAEQSAATDAAADAVETVPPIAGDEAGEFDANYRRLNIWVDRMRVAYSSYLSLQEVLAGRQAAPVLKLATGMTDANDQVVMTEIDLAAMITQAPNADAGVALARQVLQPLIDEQARQFHLSLENVCRHGSHTFKLLGDAQRK